MPHPVPAEEPVTTAFCRTMQSAWVTTATGATKLFGLSSGAVIALEATYTLSRVEQLAVYEPPLYRDCIDRDGVRRLSLSVSIPVFRAYPLSAR
jgi:hypothetical protein